jgi:hypothetical protein
MKKALAALICALWIVSAFAGFRVKLIKPKKPEQFQTSITVDGVTYAADLVISEKDQREFFYKELAPARVMAVRLAVFNRAGQELFLPLDRLQFLDASGHEIVPVAPVAVAQAVLQGKVITTEKRNQPAVGIDPRLDPRLDPNDPRNDPNDPRYGRYPPVVDPRVDPRANDPRYDPNDPRYGRYPNGTYGPYIRSGVDIVLSPGTGEGGGDLSQHEKALVEKDFSDKSHSLEPISPMSGRDKFLFFTLTDKLADTKGFTLRLPPGKGMLKEVVLKF